MPLRCENESSPPRCRISTVCDSVFCSSSANDRLDQQLVAVETRGRVAGFAGIARGAQAGNRRWNRRGIVGNDFGRERRKGVERDFKQLLGAVDLGVEVSFRAGADVALDAGHVGMRRDLIGRVLRRHHVAGCAAELRRIHVLRAVIAGCGDHQEIDDGGHQHNVDAVAEDAIVEVDAGKYSGNLTGFLQCPAAQVDADGDERQAQQEKRGKKQKEDDAQIGIVAEMARELGQPVADHGDAGASGDGAASQADGVVAEKQRGANPFFAEFIECRHVGSASMRRRARHGMASPPSIYCPTAPILIERVNRWSSRPVRDYFRVLKYAATALTCASLSPAMGFILPLPFFTVASI